jgi:Zn-dependent protease/CBS domain-containing protein
MFRSSIKLFRVGGIQIRIDPSLFLLVALITWSLAMGLFPMQFPGLPRSTFWTMGFAGAMGLFASILIHEISHSLVGIRFGLEMKSITLFLFGGMAEMPHEPKRPRVEFWMAIAGPIASLVLSGIFYAAGGIGMAAGWPVPWVGILGYLSLANVFLAIFNLVPAFPLDGGRIFRSIVWAGSGDYLKATRIATQVGSGFGLMLILLGAFRLFSGSIMGGAWWMLIGMFVRAGAQSSLRQTAISRFLNHEPVREFMNRNPVIVPPDLSVHTLVDEYLYKYDYKVFPVAREGLLLGCVGLPQIKDVSRENWDVRKVADVMRPCAPGSLVSADVEAETALRRMAETGTTQLFVADGGVLEGVISARDLMHHLRMKMELEKPPAEPTPVPA